MADETLPVSPREQWERDKADILGEARREVLYAWMEAHGKGKDAWPGWTLTDLEKLVEATNRAVASGVEVARLELVPWKQAASRKRLVVALPFIQMGAGMARVQNPEGEVKLSIVSVRPDGSGQMGAMFELEEFLGDIARVLGYEGMDDLIIKSSEE